MRIVVYGGAFNPPHMCHATVIETVERLFDCDEIWVMPSASRIDKTIVVSGEHRVAMLKLMIDEFFRNPAKPIKISTLELERPSLTTTYDTMLELKRQYPDHQFYFMVGADIVGDIETNWANGEKLAAMTNFIVIKRIDVPLPKKLPPHTQILSDAIISCNISSTFVRGLIAAGRSGLPYVTSRVAKYMAENRLYR